MNDLLLSTAGSLLATLIGFVLGYTCRSYRRSRDQATFERFYRPLIQSPKIVDIVLTTRNTPVTTINKNEFLHADLNEVRAYARLSTMFKESGVATHVSSSGTHVNLFSRGHLVTLGSPSVNRVTRLALESLKGHFPEIQMELQDEAKDIHESTFTIDGDNYSAIVNEEGQVVRDQCIVIRASNPFSPKHAMLIGFGIHSKGTLATVSSAVNAAIDRELQHRKVTGNMLVILDVEFEGNQIKTVKVKNVMPQNYPSNHSQ